MLSKNIINAILKSADTDNKDNVIKELMNHLSLIYDYNDNYKNHVLEMLVEYKAIIIKSDINIFYIESNISKFIYNAEKYNIKDLKFKHIDNIECTITFDYKYAEKTKEDNGDITYNNSTVSISYIDYPQVLKKS